MSPGCLVGYNVDDNTSDDLGAIALAATQTHVVPVVVTGMSDDSKSPVCMYVRLCVIAYACMYSYTWNVHACVCCTLRLQTCASS